MDYLVWYDSDPHTLVSAKILDACAAYQRRFHQYPNVVLVSGAEVAALAGMEVRQERTVQPNHFWVGLAEPHVATSEAE